MRVYESVVYFIFSYAHTITHIYNNNNQSPKKFTSDVLPDVTNATQTLSIQQNNTPINQEHNLHVCMGHNFICGKIIYDKG